MSNLFAQACDPGADQIREARQRAIDYRPHPLHGPQMIWRQSNCYVDMWIEVLSRWGLDPHAALPFTVAMDFEGDQFTFFKFPLADLELLYGVVVQEHAIFEPLHLHVEKQVARGNVMMVEVDACYLPDTQGASYREQHTKTTICIDAIDPVGRQLGYFHNSGYYLATASDYDALLNLGSAGGLPLAPYVECGKRRFEPLSGIRLRDTSRALLRLHLQRRPNVNPIGAFRQAFARDAKEIASRPTSYFHAYSFNTLRQLGSNFDLLGRYLRWLDASGDSDAGMLGAQIAASDTIASESMVLEFRLARASARGREDGGESSLDILEHAYESLVDGLCKVFLPTGIEAQVKGDTQVSQHNPLLIP
ncbi:DUF1839 family protein [Paraburkholderia sp. MMS20-SJTN17]|uniref:DUF1839 family protein n=1 Tax=Paraburkholderia translucens TaxID=2886945 RepID=A0ABS8KEU1_9BURK|nr:DUF1839 family protein [Paraburkholderia sp. MMS20-SJTN17]MCC8403284.1 DUF1839 family protein [Paraburkholderia sp. MMS20-SJTN17]